jgi:F-type H+-transporting ATPase subunit epsilon
MNTPLRLMIATPSGLLVDRPDVVSLRAEDATGSFGILPGHADFLTVLVPCVVRWRTAGGAHRYCAVAGGVLRVIDGERIAVACREGELGDALETLEAQAHAARESRLDAARRARVEQTRLDAQAIRQILRYLRPGSAESFVRANGAGGDA